MDLHVPESPIRSLREFLVHIGIVTIGILIALGLEQAVESWHRAHRAAEAIEGFRKELIDNQKQVEEVVHALPQLRSDIATEIARLQSDLPADAPAADAVIHYPGISINLVSSASWDAAVATQAISDLPYEIVHRYIEAFNTYRLFTQEEQSGLEVWQELHTFGEDSRKLSADERSRLIERLRRYESYCYALELVGKGTQESTERALAEH